MHYPLSLRACPGLDTGADRGRQEFHKQARTSPNGPLSLRERVGVRVKSTNAYPCQRYGGEDGHPSSQGFTISRSTDSKSPTLRMADDLRVW